MDVARAFERESGTSPEVDLEAITERMKIRKALQGGQIEEAVERVNDLDPEILEERSDLAFKMQQQQLIELIRSGNLDAALEYATENLAPRGEDDPDFLNNLEETMTLLMFKDPSISPVGNLLSAEQRQRTAGALNAAILAKDGQETEARLPALLKLLVWAQNELSEKADYPQILDLAKGTLECPPRDEIA